MLKIKDDIILENLKTLGFKKDKTSTYYNLLEGDIEVFIWINKDDKYFKHRYIYMEASEHTMILELPNIIYKLFQADMIEEG